ncbi:hypothetical protein AAFF_G00288260 [Aldrovandia affinis]|uniref:Uncharacterized protein n=1 Tax=Aldrovandia affinis TaxID=143900 RepID=A0AAD7SQY9_9TELE|nr:hypothetical protein AAFF_G00288260 [Aldrovandia affinis]
MCTQLPITSNSCVKLAASHVCAHFVKLELIFAALEQEVDALMVTVIAHISSSGLSFSRNTALLTTLPLPRKMNDEMAIVEEWLSSGLRLCELRSGTVKQPGQETGLREVVFNTPSFPLLAYRRSSVLSSLEAYTQVLNQVGRGHTPGGVGAGPYKRPAGGEGGGH